MTGLPVFGVVSNGGLLLMEWAEHGGGLAYVSSPSFANASGLAACAMSSSATTPTSRGFLYDPGR